MLLRSALRRCEDGTVLQQCRVECGAALANADNSTVLVEWKFQERPICIGTPKYQIEADVLSWGIWS